MGKRLRTTYRSCIEAGFPANKAYSIRSYVRGIDSNYNNVSDLLDTNALDWFSKILDEIIQQTTDIKLNKTTTSSWVTVDGTGNTVDKQGATRRSTTPPPNNNTQAQAPNLEKFLTKTSDLTGSEVAALLQMYSCLICKKNIHPLWRCHAMKSTYDVRLKNESSSISSNTNIDTKINIHPANYLQSTPNLCFYKSLIHQTQLYVPPKQTPQSYKK